MYYYYVLFHCHSYCVLCWLIFHTYFGMEQSVIILCKFNDNAICCVYGECQFIFLLHKYHLFYIQHCFVSMPIKPHLMYCEIENYYRISVETLFFVQIRLNMTVTYS